MPRSTAARGDSPVDDLVDVAQGDVPEVDAQLVEQPELLDRAGPVLAVREDRDAGAAVRLGGGREDAPVPLGRTTVAAGDLDHAGAVRRAPDDRTAVVVARRSRSARRPRTARPARRRSPAGSSGPDRRTGRGGGRSARSGGGPCVATARPACRRSDRCRRASRRPRCAARGPSPRPPRSVIASTSPRSKSGDSWTGRPPSMTRCSWA